MAGQDKPLVWLHGEIKTPPFSSEARVEAGLLLRRLQRGEVLKMPHARAMRAIGSGCHELRVGDKDQTWRIIYHVAAEVIVILEVFSKKSQQTPKPVLEVCRQRLQAYRKLMKEGD